MFWVRVLKEIGFPYETSKFCSVFSLTENPINSDIWAVVMGGVLAFPAVFGYLTKENVYWGFIATAKSIIILARVAKKAC